MAPDMTVMRARIVWVIVACLAWHYGVINGARGILRDSPLTVAFVLAAMALGLAALVLALSERAQKWLDGWRLFGIMTFFFVAFGVGDTVYRSGFAYSLTTDAHVYMDYAARMLWRGHNPYDTSLYGAIVGSRSPIEMQTPLDNGGMSDRMAYPALSVLWLVPFAKLGIPTAYSYAIALYGCLAILYYVAPRDLRPLVLIPFFADESYWFFAYGGITDTVWALLLCLVVVCWRRPTLAAIFFGLACSYKQHPWLLAPFLAIRIARELPKEERVRALGRFFGIGAATFFVVNGPFIVWSPKAYFQGIVEPLASAMVPLGEGFSSLLVYGGLSVPKAFFSLAFWGIFVVLLAVAASWRAMRVFVWIAPSIAFFFNYRSLNSYWYFNVLPLAVELAMAAQSGKDAFEDAPPPLLVLPWRKIAPALAVAGAGLVVAALIVSGRRNAGVDATLLSPVRTFMGLTYRIDLKITNHASATAHVTPRFWLQATTLQPLPWHATGPNELQPGETGIYSIDAPNRLSQFDISKGARITITDLDSSLRKIVEVPADHAELSPHAIPNPDFLYWDVNSGSPTLWLLTRRGSPAAHTTPLRDAPHGGFALTLDTDVARFESDLSEYCQLSPTCFAAPGAALQGRPDAEVPGQWADLGTDFVAHDGTIAFWVFTPNEANRLPALDERYGAELQFGDQRMALLLGGDPGSGSFDDGTPYEVLPGPRGVWNRVSVDLGALQKRFAPRVYPHGSTLLRFPFIDIPIIAVKFRLFFATRDKATNTALFGEIDDGQDHKDTMDDEIALLEQHPGAVDAWRSNYEWNLKNPTRAKQYLERARRNEDHEDLDLVAATQALLTEEPAEAARIFAKLLPRMPIDAELGIGNAEMLQKHPDAALPHFERALVELAKPPPSADYVARRQLQRASAWFGVADAHTLMGRCDKANEAFANVPDHERQDHFAMMKREKVFVEAPCHQP